MLLIVGLRIRIEPPFEGLWLLMIQIRKPSQKSRPASVTTNGGSRRRVMICPCTNPIVVPVARPQMIAAPQPKLIGG